MLIYNHKLFHNFNDKISAKLLNYNKKKNNENVKIFLKGLRSFILKKLKN